MAKKLHHRAARLLGHLGARGASVTMTSAPWSAQRNVQAMQRGAHKSSHGEREFVCTEMLDFCRQGYWIVLPYDAVAAWPGLRISPLGVVPQRDRRPRLIVDYSYSGINSETLPLAPKEAMQFGRALQRVMTTIVHADCGRYGPVYLAKIDIADGFYRVWLQVADIPKLGVALPTALDCPPLVAFPLALPMGWVESPPYFTALTETACDLANAALRRRPAPLQLTTAHRLEAVANTPPTDAPDASSCFSTRRKGGDNTHVSPATLHHGHHRLPVGAVDVYVDDFLLMAQTRAQQLRVMRATLTGIDDVFRPLESTDPVHRKEPASVKKMLQGDAYWSTKKRILGWDVDTAAETLHLPAHRVARLHSLLELLQPPRKRLPLPRWQQLLGELRSMAPALPGSKGLFSVLQAVLSKADRHRVKLNRRVYDVATDLRALVDDLARRPTRLRELVPTSPSDVGACDACRRGMGGVWFDALDPQSPPIVWRMAFPSHVADALITAEHPQGTLSISDLELTALIAHKDILAHARDIAERTLWMASDNRAAVSWSDKGASTSWGARAYLLRYNALHQRHHRYVTRHHYVPGPVNVMADDASRHLLAAADPDTRHRCLLDWCAVQDASTTRCSPQRSANAATAWDLWTSFCGSLRIQPRQLGTWDPVTLLQLYAQRYRDGSIAPGRRPVRARTVEDAVRTVGQAYTRMGSPDPRLNPHGLVDYRLTSLYRAWQRADDPPSRVKPLPLSLVSQVWQYAHNASPHATAAAECLVIGFYFLLRPGEYLGRPGATQFRLRDVRFWIGNRALDHFTCPPADILAATFATLTFTRQKNGVRNETVGHGRSGHPTLCPVHCLGRRALTLRAAGATPDTPLNAVRAAPNASWTYVHPSDLTSHLRAALHLHPDPAYTLHDVSIRSTRAGGAMALLCAGVDSDRIRLVGRWRSDEMYRYLHVQAQPVMTGLSAAMLRGGSFRLTPG